ncbi:MAG: hypothetical protein ABI721_00085 [Candidatus Dojkabacteria bacterium]
MNTLTTETINNVESIEVNKQKFLPDSIDDLVNRLMDNRIQLKVISNELGLDSNYLNLLNQTAIQVGFAEQNFPITTLFPDGIEELKRSLSILDEIAKILESNGLQASLNSLIPLKFDAFVKSGYAACDFLVIPKSQGQNQKLPLLGSEKQRTSLSMTPYILLEFTEKMFNEVLEKIMTYQQLFKEKKNTSSSELMPMTKTEKKAIVEVLINDMKRAFELCNQNYFQFISILNEKIIFRLSGKSLKSTEAEISFEFFLKFGVNDFEKFFTRLANAGFPVGKDFKTFKMVSKEKRMIGLSIVNLNPLTLISDDGSNFLFQELLEQKNIFPTKELAYFLDFSGLLPQIYLDDNQIEYTPYDEIQQVLQKLSLEPVIFPYRERQNIDINSATTIFDFYAYLLNNEQ